MRFIVFTRTHWSEPPRLRRQVSELLLRHGHEVHFFEKRRFGRRTNSVKEGDRLWRHIGPHLLHHQLKIFGPTNGLDARFLSWIFRKQVDFSEDDIVLSFCYDFFFLRDLLPRNTIIHVVNDDYISAAIRPHKASAKRLLETSSRRADHNLVVSYLIEEQVRVATDKVSLFFPWARHNYARPAAGKDRTEVLYWGYINERIDRQLVTGVMDAGITVNFVGNVIDSPDTRAILAHENASYHGPSPLEDIADVRDKCCAAIIPYDITNPYVPAVTISNRGFELLSFGFPLIFSDLPRLLEAPDGLIRRSTDLTQFIRAIDESRSRFDELQPTIEEFLSEHTPDSRYAQLMTVIENARNAH
ncbi:MAG: hypothetical protein AAGC71_02965 [Pseudomonadota bacterium]